MLIWSAKGRVAALLVCAALVGVFYLLPLWVIVAASVAGQWNGLLPEQLTGQHYLNAMSGQLGRQVGVSLVTGMIASAAALMVGTWSALSVRSLARWPRKLSHAVFFVPGAVPSVSVGLGLLVAFSRPPLLLNGTVAIVVLAHFILVFAYTFANISAGVQGLPADMEQVAHSLGASPAFCLRHVTLPLLMPQMVAAFSLSLALSMGELGATAMVYPPGWTTMPVGIFSLSDRGDVFDGSALSIILVAVTLVALLAVSAASSKRS